MTCSVDGGGGVSRPLCRVRGWPGGGGRSLLYTGQPLYRTPALGGGVSPEVGERCQGETGGEGEVSG